MFFLYFVLFSVFCSITTAHAVSPKALQNSAETEYHDALGVYTDQNGNFFCVFCTNSLQQCECLSYTENDQAPEISKASEVIISCKICGFSLTTATDEKLLLINSTKFARHMKKEHNDSKPYKCPFCDYEALHSGHLKCHLLSHSGKRSYNCSYCNYAGITSTALKVHERRHTGERPYKCNLCEYSCKNWSNLKSHSQSHSGEKQYKCDLCTYSTAHFTHLQEHLKIHSGEKPHKCPNCSYAAAQKSNLTVHLKTCPASK